jgi:hypothetical protein
MSKLSSWWHDFVNGLSVSDSIKENLNKYGLYVIWGVGGLIVFMLLSRLMGC